MPDADILARLRRVATRWPPAAARVVDEYVCALHEKGASEGGDTQPYWLLLPLWLYRCAPAAVRRRLGRRFLPDVCWAQYCLFLCIRIHDDLFDGHTSDMRLVYAADLLLIESERAFDPHVPDAFWPIYRELVQTSISAILEVDERQRAGSSGADGFAIHARVSSIFKAGAAAVCLATGRARAFARLAAFADEIAIVSQVFDDLRDLVEDTERGRLNSVGALLAGGADGDRPPADRLRAAGKSLLFGDGANQLTAALRASHKRARDAIRRLHVNAADAYLAGLDANITRFAAILHRSRVEARFGALVS